MKVALYDRLEFDDVPSYRRLAEVTLNSRFRPHAPDTDLVLVTHTRVPGSTTCPVVLVGSAVEVLQHLRCPVYRAPAWANHAVVDYCIQQLCERADRARLVLVVGDGPISGAVRRWVRRYWPAGLSTHDNGDGVGAVVVASRPTVAEGHYDGLLYRLHDATLVQVARGRPFSSHALQAAVEAGRVARATIDVGYADVTGREVRHTGHGAWAGHRSGERRRRVVREVIALAEAGQLEQLRRVYTRAGPTEALWP